MKKKVIIKEVLKRIIEVEADSDEKAVLKVAKSYHNEDIVLDNDDLYSAIIKCNKSKEIMY